jgi:hypothetical protein
MPTPMQIGDVLHNAVHSIEQRILGLSLAAKESTIKFESKKIVTVDGARFEVDIFVTIDSAPGYSSVVIFECKNWKKSVGTPEITHFSAKIEAVGATRGFFVAKSFTKDARALATKDKRITLLIASEHDPATSPVPLGFHAIAAEATHADVTFSGRGSDHTKSFPFEVTTATLRFRGGTPPLQEYLRQWIDQAKDKDVLNFASGNLPEGRYDREASSTRVFEPGECLVNDEEMESASILVRYHVDLYRPPVVSHFSVETRGRVYSLAPVKLPKGETLAMNIVVGPEGVPKG